MAVAVLLQSNMCVPVCIPSSSNAAAVAPRANKAFRPSHIRSCGPTMADSASILSCTADASHWASVILPLFPLTTSRRRLLALAAPTIAQPLLGSRPSRTRGVRLTACTKLASYVVSSDVALVLTVSIITLYARSYGLSLMRPLVDRLRLAFFPGSISPPRADATCIFLLPLLIFIMLLRLDFGT